MLSERNRWAMKKSRLPDRAGYGTMRFSAHQLYRNAVEPRRLEIVEGATHSFDAEVHLERAIALVLDWFKKYLQA